MVYSSEQLQQMRTEYVARGVFQVTELAICKAKGATVWDINGREYIDFVGGIGCVNAGHNPDEVVAAIQQQAEAYLHLSINIVNYQPYIALAQKLCEMTPGEHEKQAIFLNSGAEAVENAVKIARYVTQRSAVLCFDAAYHGRTLLTMSLTGKVIPYKKGYGPFAPEVYHIPHPSIDGISDWDAYWDKIFTGLVGADQVAAIIFEPELGEGGFIPMPEGFVQHLRKLCTEKGILLIADEIQTGFCRTGKLFAMEHFNVVPDLMTVGKSIASGMPLSAVVGNKKWMQVPHSGGLGGTFCGNPLACVAGLATLALYEDGRLCQRAQVIGKKVRTFFKRLQGKYYGIGAIRGLGAMIGIEFVTQNQEPDAALLRAIMARSLENGVILLSAGLHGNVLRTLMPLVITDEALEQAFLGIEKAFQAEAKLRS